MPSPRPRCPARLTPPPRQVRAQGCNLGVLPQRPLRSAHPGQLPRGVGGLDWSEKEEPEGVKPVCIGLDTSSWGNHPLLLAGHFPCALYLFTIFFGG